MDLRRLYAVWLLALAALLVPAVAAAQVTLYPNRGAWDADFPGAALETFEAADLTANDPESFAPPLDSSTDNVPFDPGDIVPGLVLTTRSDPSTVPGSNLGATLGSFPSKVVGAFGNDCDSLDMVFSPAVDGFAADLFVEGGSAGSVLVELYDGSDNLIDDETVIGGATFQTPVFFGVHSATAIARVNINNPPGSCGGFEAVDNVAFGSGGPSGVPTMSAAALLTLALVLTALIAARMRRVTA